MSLFKFNENDVYRSKIKMYPENHFFIYNNKIIYNKKSSLSGVLDSTVGMIPDGYISLYELNIDRSTGSDTYNADTQTGNRALIQPFTYKTNNAYDSTFKTINTASFFAKKVVLDSQGKPQVPILTGSYPMSASISVLYYTANQARRHVDALKNRVTYYTRYSRNFEFSNNDRDFATTEMSLVNIPSIFYGSGIKKGTVDLKLFTSGTLTAQLSDRKKNGELIQIGPVGSEQSGTVGGVILYNEGIILLTGSDSLNSAHTEDYVGAGADNPKWVYFGSTISSSQQTISSSYELSFKGIHTMPVLNMVCHARVGEINHSNNSTYIATGSLLQPITTSGLYMEDEMRKVKNLVSSAYAEPTGSFQKVVYISGINLYDKDRNLIGVAKLAKPVKKTEERDISFRLKMDL